MKTFDLLLSLILVIFLASCAANGTGTLGNGKVDINLGDGKLFGSEKAFLITFSAAQFAVYKNPALAFSVKSELEQAKSKIQDATSQFPADQAAEIAIDALRKECKFWCNTVAGKQYLDSYIVLVGEAVDEIAPGVMISPNVLIDQLIEQISLVEGSK